MSFGEEAYRLEFFVSNGYSRKKCPVCREFFWTLRGDQQLCGESPCVPYSFMGKTLTKKPYSLAETRQEFLKFFGDKDHKVIKPYPVVCRWRSDMYLTDASIVDFQPFVTNGIAPPPANPLVISQPCIRLVDLDKVGLTFGRHLTIFEMGGHHAFNYPDEKKYWKDRTVEFHDEFTTKSLGIARDSIVYKESVWSGGGNAGPCFETVAGGLELATLVFMEFKTANGKLVETPIKTVDTGYGIERFAWFSQGTFSCFDTIYREALPAIEKVIPKPLVDAELLRRYAPFTALVAPKATQRLVETRRKVSEHSGVKLEEIERKILPLEKFYAALDFSKATTFIIAEGVVPSNVKVGYLARLLIRRTFRLLSSLGHPGAFLKLIETQANYWGEFFTHLREMKDEIIEIVSSEVEKFEDTLQKGIAHVSREVETAKTTGEPLTPVLLAKMYDERGITPDIVKQVAEERGVRVDIPDNFFEIVASRHLAERIEDRQYLVPLDENGFETRKLYYEDALAKTFRAKVLKATSDIVVLDRTLFYPEGGGQIGDTGYMRSSKGETRVVDTQLVNKTITHRILGPVPSVGEEVDGEIDMNRRLKLMRHHTATHIMLGAARRVLGKHAWQAGAKKEAEKARLDIFHHKRLTFDEVMRIEHAANEVVAKRAPVKISILERNQAENAYGFSLYQGGEVPSGQIRVVEIPGWDAEACGGTHVENTEDVGLIKIIETERLQDGVERLVFAAGEAALEYIQEKEKVVHKIAEALRSPAKELDKKVSELLSELKDERKNRDRLIRILAEQRAGKLSPEARFVRGISFTKSYEDIDDTEYLIALGSLLVAGNRPSLALLLSGKEFTKIVGISNAQAVSAGVDAGKFVEVVSATMGGKGGGRSDLGQGGAKYSKLVVETFSKAEKVLEKILPESA